MAIFHLLGLMPTPAKGPFPSFPHGEMRTHIPLALLFLFCHAKIVYVRVDRGHFPLATVGDEIRACTFRCEKVLQANSIFENISYPYSRLSTKS